MHGDRTLPLFSEDLFSDLCFAELQPFVFQQLCYRFVRERAFLLRGLVEIPAELFFPERKQRRQKPAEQQSVSFSFPAQRDTSRGEGAGMRPRADKRTVRLAFALRQKHILLHQVSGFCFRLLSDLYLLQWI